MDSAYVFLIHAYPIHIQPQHTHLTSTASASVSRVLVLPLARHATLLGTTRG